MEKNVGQRMIVVAVVIVIAAVLLWPPSQKLRPGLDIAGGTSLIFEIDTTGVENATGMADKVKQVLQKRVDPSGIYNLTWRVLGSNRLEVQMPLPPKDATARRKAFADALDKLYSHELRRGQIEEALRMSGAERIAAIQNLARGNKDAALAAKDGESHRAAIDGVVAERETLLRAAAERFDALAAAREARERGPVATQPAAMPESTTAPTSQPETKESLEQAYRDASELFEDAIQDVLNTNLNRRRFEEVLDLEKTSKVRGNSLAQIQDKHADLFPEIEDVEAQYAAYRSGKRFLDGPADLKRLLRGAGKLEFRILVDNDQANPTKFDRYREHLKDGRFRPPGEEAGWFKVDNPMQFFNFDTPADLEAFRPETYAGGVVGKLENDYYVLAKLSPDDGLLQNVKGQRPWRLTRARIDRDEHGRWAVAFELDIVGGQMFEALTSRNIDKPLCILVDDVAYSAPSIRSAIRTNGQITGEFSLDKVTYLVQTMEGGTLPARLKDTPLSERTIGSSLGETNRDSAVRAGLYGTLAVFAFMIIYYWFCGAIANVAMLLNVFLTLAALAMLGARITLDGIAGLILSVGMSVDANVLIYERMREEKERGASLRMIIKNGYDRAFSTIFDSNMTTLLTCVIIYYVGSEEVKGFGLTLGWGIALNLFTAVFVTRVLFDFLLRYNLVKSVHMLKLIAVPNIDWYHKAKYFVPATIFVALVGVGLLFARGKNNVFDIEFLGGIAAEFELKQEGLNDVTIGKRLQDVASGIAQDSRRLAQAAVEPVSGDVAAYNVRLEGADARQLAAMLVEPLEHENLLARGRVTAPAGDQPLQLRVQGEVTQEQLAQKIHGLSDELAQTADNLARANVNAVLEVGGVAQHGLVWNVTTTATNMRLVEYALTTSLGDEMRTQPSVTYELRGNDDGPYPITERLLDAVVPGLPAGVNSDLTDYLGGAAIYLDRLTPPQSVANIRERLDNMHFQPDFQDLPKRRFDVIGITEAKAPDGTVLKDEKGNTLYSGVIQVVADPDFRYQDDPLIWFSGFVQPELNLIKTALTSEQTLRKVMQFKPQIAAAATEQAIMALILSWIMIVAYVWIRFGKIMYGSGAVIALIHDVLLALAFVGLSGWIASTLVGRALLVEDFKINMTIVAALLTIIGYSVNDTIVIYDRIREIRGRLGIVTPEIINNSINQTISRTIITAFTVFMVIVIAYIFGGSSIRGFNFCMLIGVITGCYSTITIASPLVIMRFGHRGVHTAVRKA